MAEPVMLSTAPFDCLECGKHVGHAGRTDSPFHVVRPGKDPLQWSFCSAVCGAAYTQRWAAEHPGEDQP